MMDTLSFICVCMFVLPFLSVDCAIDKKAYIQLRERMKNQTRMVGKTVKLKCIVTGYPRPEFTWYKDGKTIEAGIKTIKRGSRLVLRSLQVTDSGHYECIARNSHGAVRTSALLAVKGDKDGPYFEETVGPVTVIAGATAILPCNVYNLGDKYKVVWTGPKKLILSVDDRRIVDDSRISVERPFVSNWNLMIREVDEFDQGNYTCQINTEPVQSKVVTLQVEENRNKMGPNVITKKTQLFPGVMLRCEFPDCDSSVTFEWRRNGLPMYLDNSFNISFAQNSTTLEIFRLRRVVYDLVYTCAVRSTNDDSVITEANFTWIDMFSDQCADNKPPLCKIMDYGSAYVPRYLSPQNIDDAALQVHLFFPLVKIGCSNALHPFLCYLYAPPCADALRLPCRSLCLEARQGCEPVMTKFGYRWPVLFDCMAFPEDNCWSYSNTTGEPVVSESHETVLETDVLTTNTTSTQVLSTSAVPGFCVNNTIPMCKDLGYSSVYMPNNLNQTIDDIGLKLHQFWPLVKVQCSRALKPFLCYMYAPPCSEPRMPCRRLCEEARMGCGTLMNKFGLRWPDYLDCTRLPEKDCLSPYTTDNGNSLYLGNNSYVFGPTSTTSASKSNAIFTMMSPRTTKTPSTQVSSDCVDNSIPMCKDLGYSSVYMPYNQTRTIADVGLEIHQFFPLVKVQCSRALKPFLCYMYAPPCSEPRSPCRRLCEEARMGCGTLMNKFGFRWPDYLLCSRLPDTDCLSPYTIDDEHSLYLGNNTYFFGPTSTTSVSKTNATFTMKSPRATKTPLTQGDCVDNSIPMCKDLGYISVYMPPNQNRTIDDIGLEIHQFFPLVNVQCSRALKPFLCYMYAPPCSEPRPPCRRLCEEARMGCGTLMNKFGFRWPDYLDCTRLPEKDCLTLDTTDNEYQLNMDNNTHFLDLLDKLRPQPSNTTNVLSTQMSTMTTQMPQTKVESVSSGGGAIFIQANSSVYLRDNSYSAYSKKYEPITTGVYVNPRNFDIVRIEGLRTDPGDCPIDMTECYVMKFGRFGGSQIALAFSHVDAFEKARNQI